MSASIIVVVLNFVGLGAFASSASAAFGASLSGLDNNWEVTITGKIDNSNCLQVTSITHSAGGGTNLKSPSKVKCAAGFDCTPVTNNYADLTRPSSFDGCSFTAAGATSVTRTGFLLDRLCYQNFVMQQLDYNGAPGFTPDQIHVKTELEFHTRSCLLVNYCARTGFSLLVKNGGNYELSAHIESGENSAGKVYDWLKSAEHKDSNAGTSTSSRAAAVALTSTSPPAIALEAAVAPEAASSDASAKMIDMKLLLSMGVFAAMAM